jgi:hypothetical protein
LRDYGLADRTGGHGGFIAGYLLATPAFVVADLAFDMPFRVAALEGSNLRFLYYGGAMLCGGLTYVRPAVAPWVGMGESATNLFLLMLSILLPIWSMPDAILSGAPLEGPFDQTSLMNVVLSGSVLLYAYYRNQTAALSGRGPETPRWGT